MGSCHSTPKLGGSPRQVSPKSAMHPIARMFHMEDEAMIPRHTLHMCAAVSNVRRPSAITHWNQSSRVVRSSRSRLHADDPLVWAASKKIGCWSIVVCRNGLLMLVVRRMTVQTLLCVSQTDGAKMRLRRLKSARALDDKSPTSWTGQPRRVGEHKTITQHMSSRDSTQPLSNKDVIGIVLPNVRCTHRLIDQQWLLDHAGPILDTCFSTANGSAFLVFHDDFDSQGTHSPAPLAVADVVVADSFVSLSNVIQSAMRATERSSHHSV